MFSSIQKLYEQIAKGDLGGFTVPAFNIRTLTYDVMRTLFRVAKKEKVGAFIIELAQSEMAYTNQTSEEYAQTCQKAAKTERFTGPIFLQSDHLKCLDVGRLNIEKMEQLIERVMKAGFYNIDIDCSALSLEENIKQTNYFIDFIRNLEQKKKWKEFRSFHDDSSVSVGGEVGEIGGENTTIEELEKFLRQVKGVIKVAVQTGTSHGKGGKIDWDLLKHLSQKAKQYGLAGIVQHGASTLPEQDFAKFPQYGVVEIHLATQLMNVVLQSDYFPAELKEKINDWAEQNNQPIKKSLGIFKQEILKINQQNVDKIMEELEEKFKFFFKELNVVDRSDLVGETYK